MLSGLNNILYIYIFEKNCDNNEKYHDIKID